MASKFAGPLANGIAECQLPVLQSFPSCSTVFAGLESCISMTLVMLWAAPDPRYLDQSQHSCSTVDVDRALLASLGASVGDPKASLRANLVPQGRFGFDFKRFRLELGRFGVDLGGDFEFVRRCASTRSAKGRP